MSVMSRLNSPVMYLIVGTVIAFVAVLCIVFMVRAYRAGEKLGIDKVKMKRAVSASATFAVLPSVGILIGVIALSGSLGIPLPWLRLSVIGALHYETQVAEVAAETTGIALSASQMTEKAFVTIALLMGFFICWGMVFSIVFTKKYAGRLLVNKDSGTAEKNSVEKASAETSSAETSFEETSSDGIDSTSGKAVSGKEKKKKFSISDFGDTAMNAMFIGLVSAYIGSYIGDIKADSNWIPLAVAVSGALAMAFFTWLKEKKKADWVDNFSVAGSMILAMACAILFHGLR